MRLKLFGEDDIRRIAVVSITNASTTDHGLPKAHGLMDARMGSTDRSILCQTCHTPHCAGHFGMIEFPRRILLVGHIKRVVGLLRCVCVCCAQPLFSRETVAPLLDAAGPGAIERLKVVADFCRNKVSQCPSCGSPAVQFAEHNKIFIRKSVSEDAAALMDDEERAWHRRRFTPDDIYSIFEKIPEDTLKLLGMHPDKSHPKCAVTNCILVLPPAQRPTLRVTDGGKGRGEDDMTVLYQDVIRARGDLETKLDKGSVEDDAVWTSFSKLQLACACLVRNTFRKSVELPGVSSAVHGQRGAVRTMRDLEHRLKGKTGRLRGTLNAKRTDFSARTVVGIDMVHDIWQLGVPRSRMKVLTIPVRITNFNLEEMQRRIMVGAQGDGGAVNILQPLEGQEPRMIFLGLMTADARMGLAASIRPGWIVERHMQEGDWVWFNRQPTLHKMNIQAFQIYPVDGLTFRLPLPCTRPFNADFDGDEMNMHVPQSIEAATEAQELMAVPFNMVSPSNTSTIIALVQESLVAWFRLTSRNVVLKGDAFMQLMAQIQHNPRSSLYADMPRGKNEWTPLGIPPPAILKSPKGPRWTGKQILQCLLPPTINVTRPVRDGDIKDSSSWVGPKEDVVVIRKGELLLGRLCKSTLGGGPSLVHTLWKDVGPWAAAKFVSDAQRVGNMWNQKDALCIGISDCILDDATIAEVDHLVATAMGKADALETTHFPAEVKEMRATGLMQDVLRAAGALVLKRMDENTALSTVVLSGSKGNALNLSQIMGVVGQQSIGGRRVQQRKTRLGLRGLVCFPPNDRRPEALGFVATSYIQGQTESEFYHAMMAGREGIVATAIETATSGYNQRKMVKISEGQIVAYDRSVRISNADVVTFHYGGDDYDATKLERVKCVIHRVSNDALVSMLSSSDGEKPLAEELELVMLARDFLRSVLCPFVPSEFGSMLTVPFHPARLTDQMLDIPSSGSKLLTRNDHLLWMRSLIRAILVRHGCLEARDPKVSLVSLLKHPQSGRSWAKSVGMVATTWTSAFCAQSRITHAQALWLRDAVLEKISAALVAAGEAVGVIGSTSIGEPSTQGALNTFHFSGIAEKSGTTGLKRFKELLGNAKCRDTCVTNALLPEGTTPESARALAQSFKGVWLSTILDSAIILPAEDDTSPLSRRVQPLLPWVRSWMSPFGVRLDRSIEQHLARNTAVADARAVVVQLTLNKRRCLQESLVPADVCSRLRTLLQDTSLVVASEPFEDVWHVRVQPFAVDPLLSAAGTFDCRSVCEAFLDVFTTNVLVKGLSIVTDTFAVTSSIDSVQESGGIGKRSFQKVGTVGSDVFGLSWLVPDPSRLWTNDISETAQFLGVEAAVMLNNSELQRVLSLDSTYVDSRHTMLLAETMGRSGSIAALNRHKMEEHGSSLLSCASFEQTVPVLESGAWANKGDPLTGSLERQIVGLPIRVGTGVVHLKSTQALVAEERVVLAPLDEEDREERPWMSSHSVVPLDRRLEHATGSGLAPLCVDTDWTPHVTTVPPSLADSCERVVPLARTWGSALGQGQRAFLRLVFSRIDSPMFDDGVKRCDSYSGWDNPDACTSWRPTTEVAWPGGTTIVCLDSATNKGKASRVHLSKHTDATERLDKWPDGRIRAEAKVVRHVPLPLASVPDVVTPTCVTLRHRRTFEKDGWSIVFTKSWTASSNLAAEALMITEPPQLRVTVDATCAEASHNSHLHVHEVMVARGWSLWNE